jgi:hypothetical protein
MTNKPFSISVEHYDTKIRIEKDHSDLTLYDVFEIFETLCIGMTFTKELFDQVVCDLADHINEENCEKLNCE